MATRWTASEEAEIKRITETTGCNRKAAIRKMRAAKKTTKPTTSEQLQKLPELLKICLPVAKEFTSHYGETKKLIQENKQALIQLMEMFGVTQGTSGRKLDINDEMLSRDQFIEKYFACVSRYLLDQLGIKKPTAPKEKIKPQDTENYKLGWNDRAAQVVEGEEIQVAIKKVVNKRYERKIYIHQAMLVELLDAMEKVGDRLPLPLSELAKQTRAKLKAEADAVLTELEKAIEAADIKSAVDNLIEDHIEDEDECDEQADAAAAGE